jgi:hypothetical protein
MESQNGYRRSTVSTTQATYKSPDLARKCNSCSNCDAEAKVQMEMEERRWRTMLEIFIHL